MGESVYFTDRELIWVERAVRFQKAHCFSNMAMSNYLDDEEYKCLRTAAKKLEEKMQNEKIKK